MCGCKSGQCKCSQFNCGKGFAKSVGNSYVASEKKKATTSTVVPVGKRGGRPVGKR